MKQHSLNSIFAFFLKHKGVIPKFRKTKFGYRTFDNTWKAFSDNMFINHLKTVKVFNGHEYENSLEETRYKIVQDNAGTHIDFVYRKII